MARTDFDLLATAPPDEPCAEDAYEALAEGRRYIELLRRTCGPEPIGATLRVRSNPHDFGAYRTVALFFDDEDEGHVKYMHKLENEGPLKWEEA